MICYSLRHLTRNTLTLRFCSPGKFSHAPLVSNCQHSSRKMFLDKVFSWRKVSQKNKLRNTFGEYCAYLPWAKSQWRSGSGVPRRSGRLHRSSTFLTGPARFAVIAPTRGRERKSATPAAASLPCHSLTEAWHQEFWRSHDVPVIT